jgi:hypothetical protein
VTQRLEPSVLMDGSEAEISLSSANPIKEEKQKREIKNIIKNNLRCLIARPFI